MYRSRDGGPAGRRGASRASAEVGRQYRAAASRALPQGIPVPVTQCGIRQAGWVGAGLRSEGRRVGEACVSTCRSGVSPVAYKLHNTLLSLLSPSSYNHLDYFSVITN